MIKFWLNKIYSSREMIKCSLKYIFLFSVLQLFQDRKFSHQLATTCQQSSQHMNKFGHAMHTPRKLLIVASSSLPHMDHQQEGQTTVSLLVTMAVINPLDSSHPGWLNPHQPSVHLTGTIIQYFKGWFLYKCYGR